MQTTKPTKARGFPKVATCRDCGREFMKRSGAHVLCDSCSERSKQAARKRGEERRRLGNRSLLKASADAIRARQQEKPAPKMGEDFWEGYSHECKRRGSCTYGAHDSCAYSGQTGKLRSYDPETGKRHHLIVDGKCDLYKRRQGKK